MGKRDWAKGLRVPRFTDSDGTIHGAQIIAGTVPPAALDLDAVSAKIARLQRIETIDLRLEGPLGAFLHLGNLTVDGRDTLHLEFATEQGRRLFHMKGGDAPAITMGPAPVGGQQPLRVYADRMEIDNQVIVMSDVARTLLQAGRIDLLSSGTDSWDAAGATGIRLEAGWGIASKRAGVETARWDAELGEITFAGGLGRLDEKGVYYRLAEGQGAMFFFGMDESPAVPVAVLHTARGMETTTMTIMVQDFHEGPYAQGVMEIGAASMLTGDAAKIRLVAGNEAGYSPGIDLEPPPYWPVRIAGDLRVAGALSLTGDVVTSRGVYGDLHIAVWPYEYDPPDSEARAGRLLAHLQEGARYRLWLGRGETYGWAYCDFTEA
ncbi:MAG: hypothetical protein GX605_05160 [Chloroflexi bacterium]|nr:hypothetical protein [Chloroflexota bacterium]